MEKTVVRAPQGDALRFVLSDESTDRYGDVIEARGWQLDNFNRNPIALFNHNPNFIVGKWADVRVENGRLVGRLEFMEAVSERLKEIQAAVQAGILRAVSVGFRALERKPMDGGGVRYTKSELMETSLVSIPANPNALAIAKGLNLSDETIRTVFGEQADDTRETVRRKTVGEQARDLPPSSIDRKSKPMSLAQSIQDTEQNINALRDKLAEHVSKSADGVMDEANVTATDELNDRIDGLSKTLNTLRRTERTLGASSSPPSAVVTVAAPAVHRPLSVQPKAVKPGDQFIRAAAVFAVASATGKDYDSVAARLYGDDERTHMIVKAAVSGATTATAGWAAELVNTEMTAFLETLSPMSVYPVLAAAGGGRLAFGANAGAIKIPSRTPTPSISGSFVGEGAPIPVRRMGLTSITLTPKKMGVISVFSREIARYGTPAIESLIRTEVLRDTAITIDSLLLDATAGSSVRPAGIRFGVNATTATAGGGYNAILGDIRALRAPFDAANAGDGLMLLMNPAQREALGLTPMEGTLGWADSVLERYQVAVSTAIAAGTLIMVRTDDFVTATGDVPEFETSNDATIHMEDTAPLHIGTGAQGAGVLAVPTQSMFQTAQVSIRMLMDISWAMRREGMVQYMTGVTW